MKANIPLVEDEEALRITLSDRLHSEGYVVNAASTGDDGLERATQLPFDLILLDLMLPGKNGFDVCRDIRQAGLATPILILTARGEVTDKVVGLKLGADDYVTKPFEMPELLARIEALLRRAATKAPAPAGVQQFGNIRIDLRGTEVQKDRKIINLSAREFQRCAISLRTAGKLCRAMSF